MFPLKKFNPKAAPVAFGLVVLVHVLSATNTGKAVMFGAAFPAL